MMVENPVYHFRALGITTRLEGQDQVNALYAQWASTGECVFHAENEELAIGDTTICSIVTGYQPKPGAVLRATGFDVDDRDRVGARTCTAMTGEWVDHFPLRQGSC